MPEAAGIPDFNSRVVEHARKDFPLLDADMTVAEALDRIRREGIGERVIYFFAIVSSRARCFVCSRSRCRCWLVPPNKRTEPGFGGRPPSLRYGATSRPPPQCVCC